MLIGSLSNSMCVYMYTLEWLKEATLNRFYFFLYTDDMYKCVQYSKLLLFTAHVKLFLSYKEPSHFQLLQKDQSFYRAIL